MRLTLGVPVCGLLAGAAFGVWRPDVPPLLAFGVAGGCVLLAVHARRVGQGALMAAATAGLCCAAGVVMAGRAWHHAWRPTLRIAFESIARDARADAARHHRVVPEDPSAAVVLSGILTSDAALTASGAVSLALDVEWVGRIGGGTRASGADTNPVRGGVLLTVLGALGPDRMQAWRAGRRIRAPADLRRPARYLDPGVVDQERALARRGITLVGTIKSAALVDVLARGGPLDEGAASARAFARRAIEDAVGGWSGRAAAIVKAIVIGDRTGLDDKVERRLQEAGTYHVIAISGGNIAILAALTLAAFRVVGLLGRLAMISAAGGLVAYGFVVGGGASVDRAVLMAALYFLARAWDLRGPPFQLLLLTGAILTVIDPLSVADIGTLLTFGATAGIVAMTALVSLDRCPPRLQAAAGLLAASMAAEAALLPISTAVFSRVTVAGLVLNFGAIPLMAVAQLAGMAVVPLQAIAPAAARLAGWPAFVGAEGLVRTADLVTLAPWSTWRVPPPSPGAIAAYYALVCSAAWMWRLRTVAPDSRRMQRLRPWATFGALCAAAWLVFAPSAGAPGDGRLHVTFIDVGQGDAALVQLPRGSSLLVDAGGLAAGSTFDVGDRVVGPVLRSRGVRRLSTMVLTHGDADHIGGAGTVLQEFTPWDVWDGVPVPPFEPTRLLRSGALARGIRWTTVQRTDAAQLDDVDLRVHHPPLPDWERQKVRNDDSIVLELRWRDVSVVFTGDIGREIESEIAARFDRAGLRLLKVPHHGSNTSSSEAFVRALQPDVAVISVGRSNPFGHPSPMVLERYAAAGAAIFRTDQDGAVTVDSDGTSMEVATYSGRRIHLTSPRATNHRSHEGTKGTKRITGMESDDVENSNAPPR
jgi:competence protein ComEC